jgi:hypothetical protein
LSAGGGTGVAPAERVLVGLCHDLNDRLAVLHGLLHLGTRDGSVSEAAVVKLGAELERMELLVFRLRQLAREPEAVVEALIVPELLAEAVELLTHHPDRAELPIRVDAATYVPPVRSDRAALRALLLAAAGELPLVEGAAVTCGADGDDVVLGFALVPPVSVVPESVAPLAAALGVNALVTAEGVLELRLRSLLAS